MTGKRKPDVFPRLARNATVSDPSESTEAEPPSDVDEDAYPDVDAEPKDRAQRTAEAEAEEAARAEEDAEEVGGEWHVWLLAAIVVIGVALFFAPRFFLPELVGSLGVLLVVIGVLGWVVKWAIARTG